MSQIDHFLSAYIDAVARIFGKLRLSFGVAGITVSYELEAQQSLDERIAKLDAARKNLEDGIGAIDQLKHEAERSKIEVAAAADQVERLSRDKASLAAKLESMQAVMQADVDAFRQVVGVPSAAAIRRERIIGFVSGVVASLVAAGLWWGGAKLIELLTKAWAA